MFLKLSNLPLFLRSTHFLRQKTSKEKFIVSQSRVTAESLTATTTVPEVTSISPEVTSISPEVTSNVPEEKYSFAEGTHHR